MTSSPCTVPGGLWILAVTALIAHAVCALGPAALTADATDRFAVIVYAETYEDDVERVRGAGEDAAKLTGALRSAGYEVRVFPNATSGEIGQGAFWLAENLSAVGEEAFGIYYFIGHGAQIDERAYLLGVDARFGDAFELAATSAAADVVTARIGAASDRTLVVIDASTTHAGARRLALPPGLGSVEPPGEGTLILSGPPAIASGRSSDEASAFASAFADMILADQGARSAIAAMARRVRQARGGLDVWVYQRPSNRLRLASQTSALAPLTPGDGGWTPPALVVTNRHVVFGDAGPVFTAKTGNRVVLVRFEGEDGATDAGRQNTPQNTSQNTRLGPEGRPVAASVMALDALDAWLNDAAPQGEGQRRVGEGSRDVLVVVPSAGHDTRQTGVTAAALARELGFDGVVLGFSWPALAEQSPLAYQRALRNADRAGDDLASLLSALDDTQTGSITLIGDGVGARVALGALVALAEQRPPADTPSSREDLPVGPAALDPPVDNAIFVVPDAPEARFSSQLSAARPGVKLMSIYVAQDDPDLARGQAWTNAPPAAGAQLLAPAPALNIDVIVAVAETNPASPTLWRAAVLGDLSENVLSRTPAALRALAPADAPLEDAPGLAGGSAIWRLPSDDD